MKPPFKFYIFDLDGTLLNSLPDIANAVNEALIKFGLPVYQVDKYRFFVGNGIKVLAERVLPETFDFNLFPQFLAEVERQYALKQMEVTRPYPGILQMLKTLNHHSIPVAIFSNKPDSFTQVVVKHFFSDIDFVEVAGAQENLPKKPDPTIVNLMIERVKISKEQVAFIGDTATDMKTAKNAGVYAIGVSWGFREIEELISTGADRIVHQPLEILN
ncbi:MAG: HAD family hydrolase [Bacteroidales bacterium]|nr:HAD family hydrolase [Bacteroidales bacterium]